VKGGQKLKGTLARPLKVDAKSCYFFLLFFFAFFLVAMFLFSLSIFHGSAVRIRKTAIDECIEWLKIEVKKKIDANFDCGTAHECQNEFRKSRTIFIPRFFFEQRTNYPLFMLRGTRR
jgi:hypothetical protein